MRHAFSVLLLAIVWLAPGCVARQLADVEKAEAAYDRCVAERGEEDDACEALAERKRQAQRRYEADAKRSWGCDPTQAECPTKR